MPSESRVPTVRIEKDLTRLFVDSVQTSGRDYPTDEVVTHHLYPSSSLLSV